MQHYSDTNLRCCVLPSELECCIIMTLTSDAVLPTELDHSIIVTLTCDAVLPTEVDHSIIVTLTCDAAFCPGHVEDPHLRD